MDGMKKRKKLKMPSLRAGCPFCWEWLPPAELLTEVFSSDSRGGRCPCGAVFVVDETGRQGGAALLDALALACDGDLDRAQKLDSNKDYEVKTKPLGPERFQSHSPAAPKIWAVKLKK
jgi:hypothetical protein